MGEGFKFFLSSWSESGSVSVAGDGFLSSRGCKQLWGVAGDGGVGTHSYVKHT